MAYADRNLVGDGRETVPANPTWITPFPGGAAYNAMREASRAADIAASMAPDSPAALHFARLGALRLIFHLADHPELRAFQRDVIGPLEASDAARRSEFIRTLDAFLRAGGNHMRAARDLNEHRNTLIYRLERIQELLGGANLEDPETRLNLQLALKIRSALGTRPKDAEQPVEAQCPRS